MKSGTKNDLLLEFVKNRCHISTDYYICHKVDAFVKEKTGDLPLKPKMAALFTNDDA